MGWAFGFELRRDRTRWMPFHFMMGCLIVVNIFAWTVKVVDIKSVHSKPVCFYWIYPRC